MANQNVFDVLRDDDNTRRLETLRQIADANVATTVSALLEALEGEDKQLRARAVQALALLRLQEFPAVAEAFISHLKTDDSDKVRLGCAINLMRLDKTQTHDAYILAVRDKSEKVAQIACSQLSFIGGEEAIVALFKAFQHPSWNVRLEACKSLINLKVADRRVVETLETLSQEPEVKIHDAYTERFDQMSKEISLENPDEMWGKVETILECARRMAEQE